MTLRVWVAPTLILRSPAYRSSRLLVTVPFRATIVSPCIRPALSAGLLGAIPALNKPPSPVAPALSPPGSGPPRGPPPREGRLIPPAGRRPSPPPPAATLPAV